MAIAIAIWLVVYVVNTHMKSLPLIYLGVVLPVMLLLRRGFPGWPLGRNGEKRKE